MELIIEEDVSVSTVADPAPAVGGGKNIFLRFLPMAGSDVMQAKRAQIYWWGSRACLRVLQALAFLTVQYACSNVHFSWHIFYNIFNLHLCRYITKCLYF